LRWGGLTSLCRLQVRICQCRNKTPAFLPTHFAIKCYGFGAHKEPHRAASLGIKDFALDCRSFCVRKHSILKQIGRIFEQIGAKLRTRAKSNSIPEESHVLFFIRGRARVRWADHLEFKG
jgi:hypothetical protein